MDASEQTFVVLRKIASDTALLGRFLNTLSCLEYVGTRKILKSRPAEEIDATVLQHVVEEARHALLLKRLASEISPVPIPTYESRHLLSGDEAVGYFQDLDHAIEVQLLESFPADSALRATLNYLYTTLLIEERADVFYPILKAVLAERTGSSAPHQSATSVNAMDSDIPPNAHGAGCRPTPNRHEITSGSALGSISRILREEQGHKATVASAIARLDPLADSRVAALRATEHVLFTRLLTALDRAIEHTAPSR